MRDKRSKQVFIVAFCVLISVIGIYIQFIKKDTDIKDTQENAETVTEKEVETENESTQNEYDYSNKELPAVDNESDAETSTDGEDIKIYFTNTQKLDDSDMPFNVQSVLSLDTQRFLYQNGYQDVTELAVDDSGFIDNEDEISFLCSMKDYEEKFKVLYDKSENKLKFSIVFLDTEQ